MASKIRILVDTNFFINVDAVSGRGGNPTGNSLDAVCIDLYSRAHKNGVTLCLQAATEQDLLKDKSTDAAAMIKKMKKYEIVGQGLFPDAEYWSHIGTPSKPGSNSYIDDCILNALYRDAATYLVTKDTGMQRKAILLGIDDRVFSPEDCLELLIELFDPQYKIFSEVHEVELSNISISQPIFKSLIASYSEEFKNWYAKKAQCGRKAWIIGQTEDVKGIAIYDPSNEEYNNQMKVCTFKVDESARGFNLGELLMKQVLYTAFKFNKNELYVEVHPGDKDTISYFSEFGFKEIKEIIKPNGMKQIVMMKKMKPEISDYDKYLPLDFLKTFYPYYIEPAKVNSYIVPIKPEFAESLFSDSLLQPMLIENSNISNRVIKKIYVSNSQIKKMKQGDILLFYVSRKDKANPTQVITTMGVIDDIIITDNLIKLLQFAGKRTVYTESQLEEFVLGGKKALAVKFWHIDRIEKPIKIDEISVNGIKFSAPQSFAALPLEVYNELIKHNHFL